MSEWIFEHAVVTSARREDAWAYWSDMRNHARMEPGIERIELDGPFATGTIGRTITSDYTQEWQLLDVVEGRQFIVIAYTPDGAGTLSFAWEFDDHGNGTRLTQRIRAQGPQVEEHLEQLRFMEASAPHAMARLAVTLDHLAPGEHGT